MGRTFILALAVTTLGAAVSWAQTPAESLEALLHARRQAVSEYSRLYRERAALDVAFQGASRAIAARKASGQVVADAALEDLLRRHREMATRLTQLSRQVRAAAQRVREATRRLLAGIDRRVASLRLKARGRSERARAARIEVRRLLAQRSLLAGSRKRGGCTLPDVRITAADGPEEVRAKANLLRDAEERCRRRIKRVERRLARLRDERQLLQEASDFREESSLFDEESRRRVLTRVQASAATGPRGAAGEPGRSSDGNPAPNNPGETAGPSAGLGGSPSGDSTFTAAPTSVPQDSATKLSLSEQRLVDPTLASGRYESSADEIAGLTRLRLNLQRAVRRITRERRSFSRRAKALEKTR